MKKGHSSENVPIQSRLKLHLFEKGKELFNIDVESSQMFQMSFFKVPSTLKHSLRTSGEPYS